MRNKTETLLLHEVAARLRAAIPKGVPIVGADDYEELLQDGIVIAIQLRRRARKAGKNVTASNLAHYTLLHLRSGRGSTGFRTSDVLHPAAQLNGHTKVHSMDAPSNEGESGDEPLTLQDSLASTAGDPATIAARRLDWASILHSLDRTKKAILVALVKGTELTLLVPRLKRSRSALQDQKERLGRLVREHLGDDILKQVQLEPAWTNTLKRSGSGLPAERSGGQPKEHGKRRLVLFLSCQRSGVLARVVDMKSRRPRKRFFSFKTVANARTGNLIEALAQS